MTILYRLAYEATVTQQFIISIIISMTITISSTGAYTYSDTQSHTVCNCMY